MRRRTFLRSSAGLLGAAVLSPRLWSAEPRVPAQLSPGDFRKQIVGPILSLPTCYQKDQSLDFGGMRRIIELGVGNGCRIVTLTAGNSRYDQLTYDEIKELTRFMVETVARRAITIAATGAWPTEQAVEYAKFSAGLGAHTLQVTMPALDDEKQVAHFAAIAKAFPGGMVLHGQPSVELLRRLLTIESLVAFKEEYSTLYTLPLYREFGKRMTFFAGGEKARLLTYWPYGMRGYYSTFMTFAPTVATRFWRACEAGEMERAGEIVLKYESPVFERFSHRFWRATLEHFRIASRWARPPEMAFSDEEMRSLRTLFDGLGLQPNA